MTLFLTIASILVLLWSVEVTVLALVAVFGNRRHLP